MGGAGARVRSRRPLRARLWEGFAVVGLGLVITAAALAPALAARGSATTAVDGRVVAAGQPVAGVPVGFWSPTGGVRVRARTDAAGQFRFEAPTYVDGFVYAGPTPVSETALFKVGSRELVRGVIGVTRPRGRAEPLAQGHDGATPQSLAGGKPIVFTLESPGRIRAGSALLAAIGGHRGTVQVRRLDGSVLQSPTLDRNGTFTSGLLAPGNYSLLLTPRAPYLPEVVPATVASGATTVVAAPAFSVGTTLSGRLTNGGTAAAAAVPVQVLRGSDVVGSTTSGADGTYSLPLLAPGSYRLQAGRYLASGTPVLPPQPTTAVPVPEPSPSASASPTPSPSPTPTPAPTPSPIPAAGLSTVPANGRPTSDLVLPASADVVVDAGRTEVVQDLDLPPAGRVAGSVAGGSGADVDVFLEDPSSHTVLRSTTASSTGAFSLGGLVPGTSYAVYAIDRPDDAAQALYGGATLIATAGTQRVDVALSQAALTLSGRVAGATSGTVAASGIDLLGRQAEIGGDGRYRLAGLVPAAYTVDVTEPERATNNPVTVVLQSSATRDLDRGPAPAVYKAWFLSANAGVAHLSGRAVDAQGAVVTIGPETRAGHVTVRDLAPGTYSYDAPSFLGAAPARDGPWFFLPPIGTFTLRSGSTTDVGSVILRLR